MRGSRRLLVAALIGALLVIPTEAAADGGAYLEFDKTHYVPGDTGTVIAYADVPKSRRSILDRGPFYVFAYPQGMLLREGRPLPDGAVRLGTLSVSEEKGSYELAATFTMPDLPSGFYDVGVCNDPCTIGGFREPLTGTVSVVATEREGMLLTQNARLTGRLFGLRRQLRRAERQTTELEDQMTFATSERGRLTSDIGRLEEALAAARTVDVSGRPSSDPWIVAALVVVTLLAASWSLRRRRVAHPAMEP